MKTRILATLITVLLGVQLFAQNVKRPDTYYYNRGFECLREGKEADAYDYFEKETRDNPKNGYAFAWMGYILYDNEMYGDALSMLEKAQKNIPSKDKEYLCMVCRIRGDIYTDLQDYDEAAANYTKAIRLCPDDSRCYDDRADLYYQIGKYDLSDKDYDKMIELDPNDSQGYMGKGRNANAQKKYEDAIKQFDHVVKLYGKDYSQCYSFRAEAYAALDQYDKAADDIITALGIDGNDKAFYLLGTIMADSASTTMTSKLRIQQLKEPNNYYWPYCSGIVYEETENFGKAIETLAWQKDENGNEVHKGVVILIDEYDAPVGHCLDDVAKAEAVRERLSVVYSQMKNRTGDIRFLFMTGVSKFTKLSVFSALNNIVDLSQDDNYATMFGYTEDELSANFEEHLREHAAIMGKPYEDYRAEMKRWYNGFRFAKNIATTVYNPISVAYTLVKKEPAFSATWATTGRPSMLMNYLKREEVLRIDPERINGVDASEFDVAELRHLRPIAMLFQSGYLTVKDYNSITRSYTLGVPDEEVREDLCTLMTGVAANTDMQWAASLGQKLLNAMWDDFFEGLQSLYARMAYGSTERRVHENSYGRCLAFLLASQGFRFTMENVQSNGRADVVAEHPALVCIFELKVDEPVDRAFAQIRGKKYAEPFVADGRPIWLIGLSFDSKTRHLVDCAASRL